MAAQLWASRLAGDGIQVYEVRPGIMNTDMTQAVAEKYDASIKAGLVPQLRWGTARDVGLAVTALIDGNFPYSTGTVIDIDGGLQLRTL
jgi:NAD(P)-dependent dehydrogenase (short-subunit alcohol dehydrogenase family)